MIPKEVEQRKKSSWPPKNLLTCKAVSGGPALRQSDECWLQPSRRPGVRQKKKMVGLLLKSAIKLVMNNHFYSFDNIIRKQTKGGAIGNSLTE